MTIFVDSAGNETARAVQMVGKFLFDEVLFPAGSWIVILPDRRVAMHASHFAAVRDHLGRDLAA